MSPHRSLLLEFKVLVKVVIPELGVFWNVRTELLFFNGLTTQILFSFQTGLDKLFSDLRWNSLFPSFEILV